uniref:Umc1300 n=1 Tax=Arundo donax TaxID=35708 RepID=A0A0A8ZH98_ARUDO
MLQVTPMHQRNRFLWQPAEFQSLPSPLPAEFQFLWPQLGLQHSLHRPSHRLEEDGLAVAAGGAADGLGAGQRRVGGGILEHLGELAGGVVHHVPIHLVAVRYILQCSFRQALAGPSEA